MRVKLFFLLFMAVFIYAQEFQITNAPVRIYGYSIDKYTNEIYYTHDFTGDVYKTNVTGAHNELTEFPSVPRFSNNSHTAAFYYGYALYLHDFEKDTTYYLANSSSLRPNLVFSPSDSKILYTYELQATIVYYSFEDNSIHDTGITIFSYVMDWLNDTTIIYLQDNAIITFNTINQTFDSLVVDPDTVILRGLDVNNNLNAFAYSQEYYVSGNSLVNIYYTSNGVDSTVYNYWEDGPRIGYFRIFIRSLAWEQYANKLAFIGEIILNPLCGIFVFDYNTFTTNLYTNPNTTIDGIKYDLQWLNKDTVLYIDASDGYYLFGLDLTKPVNIEPYFTTEKRDQIDIKVYPNPFNNTTNIILNMPSSGGTTIELYNCLGEFLASKKYDYLAEGIHSIDFNDIKDNAYLSSGIYYIRASFISGRLSESTTIKLVYLK